MSRRKQAKPRSLKADYELNDIDNTIESVEPLCKTGKDLMRLRIVVPKNTKLLSLQDKDDSKCRETGGSKADEEFRIATTPDVPCDTNDSLESALGTERASSWTTTEDVQTSPAASSCATPSSTSDLADSDLTFTLGATESTPYVCQFCEKAFARLSILKKHEQTHGDLLPFRCAYCSRLFKHKRSRDRHIKLHTGDKKYKCAQCEAAFSRSDHLKIHMKTHDNQKPFQCTVCNRGYNTAAALTSHMLNHKKINGPQSDPCNIRCDSSISTSPETFGCLQCGNETNSTTACLRVHHRPARRKHPYHQQQGTNGAAGSSRQICAPLGAVQSHQSLDVDTRPVQGYKCMICPNETFASWDLLINHYAVWHHTNLRGFDVGDASTSQSNLLQFTANTATQATVSAIQASSGPTASAGSAAPQCYVDKSNKALYFCNMCTMRFTNPENLHNHQATVHQLFQQNIAQQAAQRAAQQIAQQAATQAAQHAAQAVAQPAAQAVAQQPAQQQEQTPSKDDAVQHQSGKHRDIPNFSEYLPLICIQCSMSFKTTESFSEHILIVHGNGVSQPSTAQQNRPKDLTINKKRRKPKQNIQETVPDPTTSNTEKPNDCYIRYRADGSVIVTPEIFETMELHLDPNRTPQSFVCAQCEMEIQDFETFRIHLKTHIVNKDDKSGVRSLLQADKLLAMLQQDGTVPCLCPHCGTTIERAQFSAHFVGHFANTIVEYGCSHCNKAFSKADDLHKHLLDMHMFHLYKCTLCKNTFESKVEVQVHFAVAHSSERTIYRCVACPDSNVTFNSLQELEIHVEVYHSQFYNGSLQPIPCPNCPLTFHSVQDMHNHALTHRQCYQCFICYKRFAIEFLLDKHMEQCHSAIQGSGSSIESEATNPFETNSKSSISKTLLPSMNSPNLSYNGKTSSPSKQSNNNNNNNIDMSKISEMATNNCDICNRNDFSNELELVNHRKLVHHMKAKAGSVSLHCAYCNENCKSRTELENHMKTHSHSSGSSTKHKCNICDELCPTAEILAQHKLTHCKVMSGNACTQCRTVITSEELFYSHIAQHSNSTSSTSPGPVTLKSAQLVLPTPCIICRQTLIAEIEVQYHAKFHLKLSSEFQCIICCKVYDKKHGILTTASAMIYGQMPSYTCKDCFVHFHSPSGKASHGDLENGGGGAPKKYSCIKCQDTFDSETAIQSHVAMHVMAEGCSHECHLCRQVLATPLQLQAHLIEHTFAGCGSYTCYICSCVFTTAQGLQNHIQEHGLAARPYDCRQCSLKFFFRAELDNHAYSHIRDMNFNDERSQHAAAAASCGTAAAISASVANVQYANTNGLGEKTSDPTKQSSPACICSKCKFTFSNASSYEKHLDRCCEAGNPPTPAFAPSEMSDVTVKIETVDVDIKMEVE